jgi:flagellar biosynthesis regulator FlbT
MDIKVAGQVAARANFEAFKALTSLGMIEGRRMAARAEANPKPSHFSLASLL